MKNQEISINVENISKCYRIGMKEEMPDTFGRMVFNFLKSPLDNYKKYRSLYKFNDLTHQKNTGKENRNSNIIWALKNISFKVKKGDVLGIIGRNGAGKSTLLKILSRITRPNSGFVDVHGKVSSLLEVGTGFHPELTGRENVYLNGTILGMKKREIDKKFDEIVEFSEISKFLDTPVKRYSSGMHVRLAFSIAAHLDPEILVIDEVLAVGDVAFQNKCLGKMENVSRGGRTVLVVSHNMGLISELCTRCILLSDGEVIEIGDPKEIIEKYISMNSTTCQSIDLQNWEVDRGGKGPMRISSLSTENSAGKTNSTFAYGEPIIFNIGVSGKRGASCIIGLSIRNSEGLMILHFSNTDDSAELVLPSSEAKIKMSLNENILNDGTYNITVWLGDGLNILHDVVRRCLNFNVESKVQGQIKSKSPVRLPVRWQVSAAKKIIRLRIVFSNWGFSRCKNSL